MKSLKDSIAFRIKERRNKLKASKSSGKRWTQSDVASLVGVELRTYQDWEGGVSSPGLENLVKLAETLGTTVSMLFGEKQSQSDREPSLEAFSILIKENASLKEQVDTMQNRINELEEMFGAIPLEIFQAMINKDNHLVVAFCATLLTGNLSYCENLPDSVVPEVEKVARVLGKKKAV